MKKQLLAITFGAMLVAYSVPAQAQQPEKTFRIGFLDSSTASGMAVLFEAFWQEMRKLGWIQGKNIAVEYRFAEGKNDRLPELAADLVRLKVDLIVVSSGGGDKLSGEEGNQYHPHRARDLCGSCRRWYSGQSGAAGRQCHWFLEFSGRAGYQKAGDTKGRSP